MDYDGWVQIGKGIAICYGVVAIVAAVMAAWLLPKIKAARPRITDDIDDAEVLRGPDVSDKEAA